MLSRFVCRSKVKNSSCKCSLVMSKMFIYWNLLLFIVNRHVTKYYSLTGKLLKLTRIVLLSNKFRVILKKVIWLTLNKLGHPNQIQRHDWGHSRCTVKCTQITLSNSETNNKRGQCLTLTYTVVSPKLEPANTVLITHNPKEFYKQTLINSCAKPVVPSFSNQKQRWIQKFIPY